MSASGESYQGNRGAFYKSFSQILMKNLPAAPKLSRSPKPSPVFPGPRQSAGSTVTSACAVEPYDSAKTQIDKYLSGDTHAVSLLHQLAQILQFHLEIRETVTTGNVKGFYFAFCVVIDGKVYKTGMGKTKKEARLKAADLALQVLLPTFGFRKSGLPGASEVSPTEPLKEEPSNFGVHSRRVHEKKRSFNPQIPLAVKEKLTELLKSHPEFSFCTTTTAAFIVHTHSGCEVVALGTGDFNTKDSASPNGRIVHDSHAVVTARRSLMRFLYRHLLMFFSKNANLTTKSIFRQTGTSSLLSLKSGVTVHLYINQLPKGAAQIHSNMRLNPLSISAWQVNNEISLHLSVEGKVFSVFSSAVERSPSKVVSMSASDKVTQWQVVGYQGALLSHFMEPIYVHSILVGDADCVDIRGMEISVCQRSERITTQLPMFFCMIRPHISLVPYVASTSTDGDPVAHGINWSQGDTSLEVVDGLQGKTIEGSPFKSGPALASRLCKAAMLHRFTMVAKEAQRQDLLAASTYREAKRMAKPYQEAKNMLRAYLLQQGFGCWLDKVSVSDNFSM
ncbi:adenosine deaminase domain-containing protein 1 [Embiotoca jacksoni]|uniref:adenosine deaminase domain-containing protein 1 n=1 Tax=Embiotoca jacksoni TaxID=100190 RepID=UPI003703BD24